MSSKLFCITIPKAEAVAYISKKRGFNQDILVYSLDGHKVATLHQELKMRTQKLVAISAEGECLLIAKGKNGSIDFSVEEWGVSEIVISRINKRSNSTPTLKESLLSGDQYFVTNNQKISELQQLIVIVMTIVISEQLHLA